MTDFLVRCFIKNHDKTDSAAVRKQYGILSGFIGIFCNFLLCLLKFISGVLVSSIGIIADAFNNLSDAVSSVVTLVGFKLSDKPADKEHPFGYGRFEYISGLIISIIIIFMGIELIKSSIEKIFNPEIVVFNKFSIGILIFSLFVKLWMCFFNKKLGKIINSATLKTVSIDSLSDVIATTAVLVGSIVSSLTGLMLDSYCGLIVALFIIYTGIKTAKTTLDPLIGEDPDEQYIEKIKKEVLAYDGIFGVHSIIVHNYGPTNLLVSLHVEIAAEETVAKAHGLIDEIEKELKKKLKCNVVIHVDPKTV